MLRVLDSPHKALRHTVGTNVAGIVGMANLASWPELLIKLVACLESSDPSALEGALDALYKVAVLLLAGGQLNRLAPSACCSQGSFRV